MHDIHNILRTRLLERAGLGEPAPRLDYDKLRLTEWSPEFEQLMRNRMVLGAFRYGLLNDPKKPNWDRIPSIQRRLVAYQQDGNLEHLVDAANLCQLEFEEGRHPNRHFAAVDDGEHCTIRG